MAGCVLRVSTIRLGGHPRGKQPQSSECFSETSPLRGRLSQECSGVHGNHGKSLSAPEEADLAQMNQASAIR